MIKYKQSLAVCDGGRRRRQAGPARQEPIPACNKYIHLFNTVYYSLLIECNILDVLEKIQNRLGINHWNITDVYKVRGPIKCETPINIDQFIFIFSSLLHQSCNLL